MHINDAVFLEDLCPKFRLRQRRNQYIDLQEKVAYIAENHLNLLTM